MTAQQISTEINDELIQWAKNEMSKQVELASQKVSRKRSWLNIIDSDELEEQERSISPPEKTIRLDIVDTSRESTKDILSAYKRIWDNLDLSKPTDAKLEPFVWQKIRELQKK